MEKIEKISQNNKAWSTRNSDTSKNTFAIKAIGNGSADNKHEEME